MSHEDPSTGTDRRSYANVVLVQRVLAVLQAVNKMTNITVTGISDACGIPGPSVVRILETLCAEGFLVHMSRRGGYALSSHICTLSAGYHGTPLLVEILKTHVDELTRFHAWPFSVATLDRDAMVVQYSSIPLSPLAHVRSTFHKRLSLLSRAHGLAYTASCNSVERRHLVRVAIEAGNPEDRIIDSVRSWRRLLTQTRARGYALRATDVDQFTQTIAVPIVLEPGRVIGTLGMTFFRRVVREAQYADYAAVLKLTASAAAQRIREEMALRSPGIGQPTSAAASMSQAAGDAARAASQRAAHPGRDSTSAKSRATIGARPVSAK